MARLNPKRRLLARLKEWDKQAHALTVQANADPLQDGKVRSCVQMFANKSGALRPPRENWEGVGKRGKVVGGKLKRVIPGTVGRFAKS